jgi:hypothetical protein
MKEHFIDYKPKPEAESVIDHANDIIDDYARQGLKLSVRQVYYRFVAADLIPNNMKSYNRLKDIINRGRLAGMIDWAAIEDRGRRWMFNNHWKQPSEFMQSVVDYDWYAVDKWANQDVLVEVWVEKNALIGVLESVCEALDVRFYACVGYNSQSMQYEAAKRFQMWRRAGRRPVVLHLGDHDPSGLDMTRDNLERLELMSGGSVEVNRIALNMDQITDDTPPNYAKPTDARTPAYIQKFGTEDCWELDALEPAAMSELITNEVLMYRDEDLFNEQTELEEEHRDRLRHVQFDLEAQEQDGNED